MRSFGGSVLRQSRTALIFSLLATLFAMPSDATGQTDSRSRRDDFVAPYQPFAPGADTSNNPQNVEPIALETSAPTATRVAYYVRRRAPVAPPRAERVDDYDMQEMREPDEETAPEPEQRESRPMVAGSRAMLRNGIAYAPAHAPDSVKAAIWAANTLRRKPYAWGGGHGSFRDDGYDCSGSVSFALHGGGLLTTPLPSSDFMRYGRRGRGRWITIYSRPGHTFAVIAGLRFDTTDFRDGDVGPRWHSDGRDTRGFVARHPEGT